MQFLQLLRKLNASQQSIHKVIGYAIKYGSKCGEDLWECILEECGKVGLSSIDLSESSLERDDARKFE
jgi:CTD kinase subunit gamma